MSEEELIELFPELRDEPADKVFKILDEQESVFDSEEEAEQAIKREEQEKEEKK